MTEDRGKLIKNIYYMLSYAFRALKGNRFERIAKEDFDDAGDLFAEILSLAVSKQLKQGLQREYCERADELAVFRGKIDMPGTIALKVRRRQNLYCIYDELSEDNALNRILKVTMRTLALSPDVKPERKVKLNALLRYFNGVSDMPTNAINWSVLKFNRYNMMYVMMINICFFVLHNLLQTTKAGEYKMQAFSDAQMEKVFEGFVREYYRTEHSEFITRSPQVKWALDSGFPAKNLPLLPVMQADTSLETEGKKLIIDTKYYSSAANARYGTDKLISGNLYQIFTYVKNEQHSSPHTQITGLLLYAKSKNDKDIDFDCSVGGNRIAARTLDLNCDFAQIKAQLDGIVADFLL